MKYKLGDLISLINGYTFKRKDFIDEGIPVTKIKNIVSPYVNIQLDPSYVSLKYNLEDKFQIHYGDILIALTGSNVSQKNSMVGKIGRYLDHRISYLNQRVGKIKVTSPKLDEDYLYYWLVRPQVRYYLALNAGGSANQANISAKSIYDLEIDLPNIDEQKRIVRKLITIDQQTSLNNQINANLAV